MTFATLTNVTEQAAPDDEMRLDELAHTSRVPSTTIRLYQNKGLLPGPRLVGRTGYYGRHHLARLRLINRLQDEGFGLAGIGRILESWETRRGLADLLGIEEQLDALLARRYATTLSLEDLATRLPPEALTPETMQRAAALGLITPTDDGNVRIPDSRFLDTGIALIELGVPIAVILDQWEHLAATTDELAARFISLFEEHILPAGWSEDLDADRANELAATLARLRDLAGQIVGTSLDASIAREGTKRLGDRLTPASPPTDQPSTRRGRRRAEARP